jgi:hypothetical protein
MDRTVAVLLAFAGVGILVRLLNLVVIFDPRFMNYFWLAWIGGLAILVVARNVATGEPRNQQMASAASALDHRAKLHDEVVSAWWFLDHEVRGPWIDLHVGRAAEKLQSLDVGRLLPLEVPPRSGLALGAIGAMILLAFVPLPFVPGLLLSTPLPTDVATFPDRDEELDEIEALLGEAREIDPANGQDLAAIQEFEQLVDQMRDPDLSLADTAAQANAVDALVDEGNLNTNSLLEGLEEMGSDLRRAEETTPVGEALSRGDLDSAAEEFAALAESLAADNAPSGELQQALEQAAENARAGLEDLAAALEQAAQALANQDAAAASESMMEAAQSVDDLSDLVESQQFQNQAAQRMDALREEMRQQENAAGQATEAGGSASESTDAESGGEGDPSRAAGAPQGGQQSGQSQGTMPPEALEPGAPQGASEGASGEPSDGDVPAGAVPSMTGNTQGLDPSGTGEIPTGLGFSPEQKTGEATSLDVQLLMESTAAAAGEAATEPEDRREEATRQERSRLDYRNVPSELTPAQQELLNQERIPREYRNVIREYFQAIRPQNGGAPTGETGETGETDD